ncbi:sensor histidine kinase [Nocardia sp. 2]|uniref:Oxygen sensor histidine kinase NreB n=1 Tax=Nocardia acididurans TaxID=2802282 RepID=A0ABS1M207_9NOCA|nr:sensor histidine kinase [Nocardia acididurans]MBL1074692.1 sensor histidine kinase [Nocardia acididurans]
MRKTGAGGDDSRLLATIVHCAFSVLLAASLLRYLLRHSGAPQLPWVLALVSVVMVLYVVSELRESRRVLWFVLLVAAWTALVLLAPSFAWCAVPLLYTGLRILPLRIALGLVAALTGLVVVTQVRLAGWADPNLLLAPIAVAALSTALFVGMQRQAARQAALIDTLRTTRAELAETERRAGVLAERERLAREIHDTLAQGLSSQRMLLQAADRVWDSDSGQARAHVRTAAEVAEHNLAEARRFVHDLTPSDLAAGGSLEAALTALARRENDENLSVRFHLDGIPAPLPEPVAAALLRIAQGALANAREHAHAARVTLSLTHLGDHVVLDIADDGTGFDPDAPVSAPRRGHGLPAMRARMRQLGGGLTIESVPGDGTVITASVPLELS